jgi:hypothetical protein
VTTGDVAMRVFGWLAVYGYGRTLLLRWLGNREGLARWMWTCGLAGLSIHLVLAFAVAHGWSQEHAYDHIAERTANEVGWRFGEGLYVNYAFVALWLADAAWWWTSPRSYQARPRLIEWLIQAAFAVIMVNAAIVFATPLGRWVALAIGLALVVEAVPLVRHRRFG